MQKTIEVVYDNGVFKPLEPVELKEIVKRRIVIEEEHFEKFFGIFKDKEISVEEERDLMLSERAWKYFWTLLSLSIFLVILKDQVSFDNIFCLAHPFLC